jgi:hypothetical protein
LDLTPPQPEESPPREWGEGGGERTRAIPEFSLPNVGRGLENTYPESLVRRGQELIRINFTSYYRTFTFNLIVLERGRGTGGEGEQFHNRLSLIASCPRLIAQYFLNGFSKYF